MVFAVIQIVGDGQEVVRVHGGEGGSHDVPSVGVVPGLELGEEGAAFDVVAVDLEDFVRVSGVDADDVGAVVCVRWGFFCFGFGGRGIRGIRARQVRSRMLAWRKPVTLMIVRSGCWIVVLRRQMTVS